MSINWLTNAEMARVRQASASAAAPPGVAFGPAVAAPPAAPEKENRVDNALNVLTKYIPTETITLYVAAVAATPAIEQVTKQLVNGWLVYGFFAILTPFILLLVLVSKRATEKLSPLLPQPLPWWKMVASFIAFSVWALSVPNNPFTQSNNVAAVLAAFGAIFISFFLSQFDSIFDRVGG